MLDASAMVELLIGSPLGAAVRSRIAHHELHAPAHFDAEVLSALGRLARAGLVDDTNVAAKLGALADAPITRHAIGPVLLEAWSLRENLRLVDAVYVVIAQKLGFTLVTTDQRLASATPVTELVTL